MPFFECITCGGVYQNPLQDGMLYFHACPPIPNRETGQFEERPDKRDENIVLDEATGKVRLKSEGKGRRPVAPPVPPRDPAIPRPGEETPTPGGL